MRKGGKQIRFTLNPSIIASKAAYVQVAKANRSATKLGVRNLEEKERG